MGDVLICGEKQAGKSTLIKLCMDKTNTKLDEYQELQIWTDKKSNIKFYETHLDSAESFETLYTKTPKLRGCKVCWFLISASSVISSVFEMIHLILAKKIRIVFVVTKCDIYRSNIPIEEDIHEEFGPKHKIIRFILNEDYYSNHVEFQAQITTLYGYTNKICKIFPDTVDGEVKQNKPPQNTSNAGNAHNYESNTSNAGMLSSLLGNKYSKTIEIFFLHYKILCKEKDPFVKDFIGNLSTASTGNDKYKKYEFNGGKIVLYDILEALIDEISIVDTLRKLRPGNNDSFKIYTFFVANKNMKPEIDISINDTLKNFLSDSPKIFLSFKSKIKILTIDVKNSDKIIQAAKEERQNILNQILINHVTHASTFNSERQLFLTGVQKYSTLLLTISEQYYAGIESNFQSQGFKPATSNEQPKKFEINQQTITKPVPSNKTSQAPSSFQEVRKKFETNQQTITKPEPPKKPNQTTFQHSKKSSEQSTTEQDKVTKSYPCILPKELKEFAIFVTGEPNSGKTTLIKAVLVDISDDIDSTKDEFKITRGENSITFIEHHGSFISQEDISVFNQRFERISQRYNCLICWNVTKSPPNVLTKRLIKNLSTNFGIPTMIIYTNLLEGSSSKLLREQPTLYSANHISWVPSVSQRSEGYNFEESIFEILTASRNLLTGQLNKKEIDILINHRSVVKKSVNVNEYENFELLKEAEIRNGLEAERMNLMLIGPTGVGKSTLINTILKTTKAYVDDTQPGTYEFDEYEVKDSPITLIDSRGFEQDKFEKIRDTVDLEIATRSSNDLKRVHMIWYCVRMESDRFVDAEYDMVEKWRNDGIPVIILVTNAALQGNFDKIINEQRNYPLYEDLINSNDKQSIISGRVIVSKVLAKEVVLQDLCGIDVHIAPYGIQRLFDLMRYFLPEGKKYITAQMKKNLAPNLSHIIKSICNTEVEMINIMVVGNTGVGKSRLIKTVFEIDVKSSTGRSVTQEIKQYMVRDKPISIYDTIGFEYGRYREIKKEIIDTITSKSKEHPSRHIHIVWYVINDSAHRIEDNDKEIIQAIKRMKIPVIIVLNKGPPEQLGRRDSLMKGIIDGINVPDLNTILKCNEEGKKKLIQLGLSVIKTNVLNAYYQNKIVIPIYGTGELVQLTQLYVDMASKNALCTSIINIDQKHTHIIDEVVPKYVANADKKWVFSTQFRTNIIYYTTVDMYTEIMNTYNFDWSYEVVTDILSDLYVRSQKFQNRTDKVVGGLWFFGAFGTRSSALDFLAKTGRIFSESFKNLVLRTKDVSKIKTEDYSNQLVNLYELEFN